MLATGGWLAAWFILSGAPLKVSQWAGESFNEATATQGFAVRNLLVEGRINTDPHILRALLNVEKGDPIFAFDPQEARESVRRLSWVKDARIERRFPDTIYINLTERKPLALWQNKGKLRLIDDEGVTLTDENLERFGSLIILVGDDAPERAAELVGLLAAEPSLQPEIEAATRVGERRWDLKTKKGITVQMPEDDFALALSRLARAQKEDDLLNKDLISIDLREEDRLTVRTRPGAVQEYKASLAGGSDI